MKKEDEKPVNDEYVLFTNIQFVIINNVRTYTHALLLEDAQGVLDPKSRSYSLRGFSLDETVPSFDFPLNSKTYELIDAHSGAIFIGNRGPRPLASGYIMRFENGPTVQLFTATTQPLCIDEISGDPCTSPVLRVWAILQPRIRQHWDAPNMPTVKWVRVRS